MWRVARTSLAAAIGLSACALLKSTPEDTPPEAPNARTFRMLPPGRRDELLPPPAAYVSPDFLDRLVCENGDPPNWKRSNKRGMIETFEVQCPEVESRTLVLDTTVAPPNAPEGMRLLNEKSLPQFREALQAADKKNYTRMLAQLDLALQITPGEPVYRRERMHALYLLGRPLEALLEADDLLKVFPTPLVYRYRASAAIQLGMKEAVMSSLDGIIAHTKPGNPIYAEAVCTKGIFLSRAGNPAGKALLQEGCALSYQACCDEMTSTPPAEEKPAQSM
jgi:hypothetical protein